MPRWCRAAYSSGICALVLAYFLLPDPPRLLWAAIGFLSVAAVATGVRINRPAWALPWLLLAAGTATFVGGDITYDVLTNVLGRENPFPSAADVLYLISYPLWAAGLLLMVRARSVGSDRGALLDAFIITIGLGLLSWVFLAKPYVEDASLTWLEKACSVAYPLGDILLLAMLARLLLGGSRNRAMELLGIGMLGLLSSDVLYGLTQLNGEWSTGGPVDSGWIMFYACWGAAALNPQMGSLVRPVARRSGGLTRPRLLLLASASLVPPGLLLVESLAHGDMLDAGVIALTSVALFLLVTARLDGLIMVARRSVQREHALRRAGEALVAASSREEVCEASARAVLDITGDPAEHRILLILDVDGRPQVVHDSARATLPRAPHIDAPAIVAAHTAKLYQQHYVRTASDRDGNAALCGLPPGVAMLLAPLGRDAEAVGAMLVVGHEVRRPGVIDAVCAIGAQTLLALESRALIEQVLQQRSETHFRSLIQNASDVILVVDPGLRIVYQTPSVQAVLGYLPEEIQDRPVVDLVSDEDGQSAALLLVRAVSPAPAQSRVEAVTEWRVRHADGRVLRAEVTCRSLLDDPSVNGLVLTMRDVTQKRVLEEELKHLAFHDSLTGLPNRALFLDRVEHALRRRGRAEAQVAVMLIDLDDFKLVNDTRGHAVGDSLLVAVGERLRGALRAGDTAARLGGDEFAVLVEDLQNADEASDLAARILAALQEPYTLGDETTAARASVGVVLSGPQSQAPELLRQADLAMYAAKDAGKGTHELFRSSLEDRMNVRLELRRDLELGLARSEFLLHYQPIFDLATRAITGVEALMRWQHPERGLVMPGQFIHAVEDTDLAVPLGSWVLDEAVAQAAAWLRRFPDSAPLRMSVNVSPRQLLDPAFVGIVTATLAQHGFPASSLTLEITERFLAGDDPQPLAAMAQLRALGVSFALDDFGTGYSALGYLRRFPVDVLKIDRSFVAGVERPGDDRALVEAIVRLAETFGLGLVAEGIESDEQREALLALGCDTGQGFLLSRPVPIDALGALLESQEALPVACVPA